MCLHVRQVSTINVITQCNPVVHHHVRVYAPVAAQSVPMAIVARPRVVLHQQRPVPRAYWSPRHAQVRLDRPPYCLYRVTCQPYRNKVSPRGPLRARPPVLAAVPIRAITSTRTDRIRVVEVVTAHCR